MNRDSSGSLMRSTIGVEEITWAVSMKNAGAVRIRNRASNECVPRLERNMLGRGQ